MDLKLFISTFLLIFLAEMGDKTQLTAMARAAGSESAKWTVFAAAGAALLLSTLLAVTLGKVIARYVPDHIVRLSAAILFIVFGLLLLIGALQRGSSAATPTTDAGAPAAETGMMMRAVLRIAAEFEEAAAMDYARLAQEAVDPATRKLLQELEEDERWHLQLMRDAGKSPEHKAVQLDSLLRTDLPSEPELQHDVAISDKPVLAHAIEHEQNTMLFYEELARRTPIPALRRTFTQLANAERVHVERIRDLLSRSGTEQT